MRHRKVDHKIGRNTEHRRSMRRNMLSALFKLERIVTTIPRARAFRAPAEKLITLAKIRSLHNIRRAQAALQDKEAVTKLFDVLGPRYKDRPGGYTRILKLPKRRLGDSGTKAIFELVDNQVLEKQKEARAAKAAE
jgi:large subunit ribosomal protein L17